MTATVADDRSIKVLVYTDARYRGGSEMTLAQVLAALPDRIQVTVAGVVPEVVDWLAAHRPGAAVEHLPPIEGRTDLGPMIAHARRFRRVAPDIVHFNLGSVSSSQWAVFIAVVKGRYRTLAVENSPVGAWSSMSATLKRFTSPRLSAHVAVGEATARTVEDVVKLKAGSVGTLYHGVPDVARDLPREAHDGPVILNIARHQHVKGVDVLVQAMALLPADVKLVQVGRGEETDRLLALRDELGLGDRVEFRDLPWDVRAADVIAGFDLFVLPSRNEGLPVTVMEAMLAGVAIVATDVGAIREELADGESGRIAPPEDPAALAKAIGELLADDAARVAMGRRAREVALERFTVEATVARYCELYDRLVG
jgi:glycosyltransferase involved in cell wall biosynthesis